jgi:5'-nucleotidase/UDP-sugar diphosphatase
MRNASAVALAVVLLAACGDDSPSERHLVILHTNDEHSHLFGFGPEIDDFPPPDQPGDGTIVGNIARRATLLDQERAAADAAGAETLTVSAGDETQGALPQIGFASTSPDFVFMQQLGYDVMCPGNHEFDLGPASYAAAIEAARDGGGVPQLVSTNIHFSDDDPADDSLAALYGEGDSSQPIKRYHVVTTASGLKVGFIGIMGVNAAFFAPLKVPVEFSGQLADEGNQNKILPAIYADLEPSIKALREEEKVDLVIALSHSGVNTIDPTVGDDYQIAAHVAGIDAIISGHSHTPLTEPQLVEAPDGYLVPIVQAGSFGQYLGRLELVVSPGQRPRLETGGTKLITVDDTTVPADSSITDQLDTLIASLESDALPDQLSRIEGAPVSDDPGTLGDLYYRPLGATDFDVVGLRRSVETNMLDLSTDSMMATAETLVGPTLAAVQAAGSIRADIQKGKTGVLSYADLYRILPLGENPVDGSIGYPLCHFYIYTAELKAAFEIGASRGLIDDSLFLGASGIKVEFDTSRAPQNLAGGVAAALDPQNGRVTKITVDVDHSDGYDQPTVVLFDVSRTGNEWNSSLGDALTLQPVVTSLYVASFADAAGVTLKDAAGAAVELNDTIIKRPDQSDVKDYEALIGYIRQECAANDGTLPARYDENNAAGTVPRRMFCTGSDCP